MSKWIEMMNINARPIDSAVKHQSSLRLAIHKKEKNAPNNR